MIELVVVQPTSLCNLNCRYCYVPNRQDSFIMDFSTLELIISKVLESPIIEKRVEFLWHAGEPLTAGISFYEKVIDLVNKYNSHRIITNSIQTNGVLITEEWCKLFKKHNFSIGISIDGPAFIHDSQRKNWGNQGTHEKVMNGVKLLRNYDISFGALCVITSMSLNYPHEIFDFFYDNKFKSVGFNVEEIENSNRTSSLRKALKNDMVGTIERYSNFFSIMFDRWKVHSKDLRIREFSDFINKINTKRSRPDFYAEPDEVKDLAIITFQKNGDITTNSPEFAGVMSTEYQNFVVGNIRTINRIEDIFTSPVYLHMKSDIQKGIYNCAGGCSYFDLCGGAFLSNKYAENGTLNSSETTTCILHRKTLSSVLIDKLTHLDG
jgi:uncharacterized protein